MMLDPQNYHKTLLVGYTYYKLDKTYYCVYRIFLGSNDSNGYVLFN